MLDPFVAMAYAAGAQPIITTNYGTVHVTIINTGAAAINGWRLTSRSLETPGWVTPGMPT